MFGTILALVILGIFPVCAKAQDAPAPIPQSREQIQLSFAPLVRQIAPAVVNIYTKRTVQRAETNPFMNDPFFAPFFNNNMFGGRMRKQVESALGSGLIIDPAGVVVTNAHVINGAQEIRVVLVDGREFSAVVTLQDTPSDLALLQLDTKEKDLPHATLKPSETLEVGDLVLAIGNPFGVGQTVTSGIVSALARSAVDASDFNFFIQTDAAINPGNSGGPLVALDGGVVGINSSIYSRDGGSLGIGFAIPSEMVASVLAAAHSGISTAHGVVRPWLGITAQDLTSEIANSLNIKTPQGVLVAALHSESPLRAAGVNVGDVVLAINGHDIRNAAELKFRMATVPIGQNAHMKILRQGKTQDMDVKAMAAPDVPPRQETVIKDQSPLSGATLALVNPAVAMKLGLAEAEEGTVAVIDVAEGSTASRVVTIGDQLVSINDLPIKAPRDVQKALASGARSGWSFMIKNQGRTRQLVIR